MSGVVPTEFTPSRDPPPRPPPSALTHGDGPWGGGLVPRVRPCGSVLSMHQNYACIQHSP